MAIELISNYSLFLLKAITVVISVLIILSAIINSKKNTNEGSLSVKNINDELDDIEENIKKNIFKKADFKKFLKLKKKSNKILEKKQYKLSTVQKNKIDTFIDKYQEEDTELILDLINRTELVLLNNS